MNRAFLRQQEATEDTLRTVTRERDLLLQIEELQAKLAKMHKEEAKLEDRITALVNRQRLLSP